MLCEKCKIREANIKYTEIINGVKKEHNLCSPCAREMDFGPYSALFEGEFPLGALLSGLLGLSDSAAKQQKTQEVLCPTCGTSYEEFIKNSRFGCADCYHMFDLLMRERIKKLQDHSSHTGKQPKLRAAQRQEAKVSSRGELQFTKEEQIRQLERCLKAALAEEDYELAAACRDQIRAQKEGRACDDEMV